MAGVQQADAAGCLQSVCGPDTPARTDLRLNLCSVGELQWRVQLKESGLHGGVGVLEVGGSSRPMAAGRLNLWAVGGRGDGEEVWVGLRLHATNWETSEQVLHR